MDEHSNDWHKEHGEKLLAQTDLVIMTNKMRRLREDLIFDTSLDDAIREIELSISVLHTQQEKCGVRHLGVELPLHNALRMLREKKSKEVN